MLSSIPPACVGAKVSSSSVSFAGASSSSSSSSANAASSSVSIFSVSSSSFFFVFLLGVALGLLPPRFFVGVGERDAAAVFFFFFEGVVPVEVVVVVFSPIFFFFFEGVVVVVVVVPADFSFTGVALALLVVLLVVGDIIATSSNNSSAVCCSFVVVFFLGVAVVVFFFDDDFGVVVVFFFFGVDCGVVCREDARRVGVAIIAVVFLSLRSLARSLSPFPRALFKKRSEEEKNQAKEKRIFFFEFLTKTLNITKKKNSSLSENGVLILHFSLCAPLLRVDREQKEIKNGIYFRLLCVRRTARNANEQKYHEMRESNVGFLSRV